MRKSKMTVQSFREQIQSLPFDPLLHTYKQDLLKERNPFEFLIFPNQFFYISDNVSMKNLLVHPNIETLLGYKPEKFINPEFLYNLIHPEDREFVLAFSLKTIQYSRKLKELLIKNPFCDVFSIDFRVKKFNGSEIRLNRQSSCYRVDHEGNMTHSLSIFTDISHLKKTRLITYSWTGEGLKDFYIDDILAFSKNVAFSKREIEVLNFLSRGMEGKEIASRMCISEHTIISHRKNMLHKTHTRNTAELVKFAAEYGLLGVSS